MSIFIIHSSCEFTSSIEEIRPIAGWGDLSILCRTCCLDTSGYLGYELWVDPGDALALWDAIFGVKERGLYDLRPIGLDALEMVRIKAGFVMPGDDFNTAESTVRAGHDRTLFELGLDWVASWDKPYFTGRRALQKEQAQPLHDSLNPTIKA